MIANIFIHRILMCEILNKILLLLQLCAGRAGWMAKPAGLPEVAWLAGLAGLVSGLEALAVLNHRLGTSGSGIGPIGRLKT